MNIFNILAKDLGAFIKSNFNWIDGLSILRVYQPFYLKGKYGLSRINLSLEKYLVAILINGAPFITKIPNPKRALKCIFIQWHLWRQLYFKIHILDISVATWTLQIHA